MKERRDRRLLPRIFYADLSRCIELLIARFFSVG